MPPRVLCKAFPQYASVIPAVTNDERIKIARQGNPACDAYAQAIYETIVRKIVGRGKNIFDTLFDNLEVNSRAGYIFPDDYQRLLQILNDSEERFCALLHGVQETKMFRPKAGSGGASLAINTPERWADVILEVLDLIAKLDDQIRNPLLQAISVEGIQTSQTRCKAATAASCAPPCEKGTFGGCTYNKLNAEHAPACQYQQRYRSLSV